MNDNWAVAQHGRIAPGIPQKRTSQRGLSQDPPGVSGAGRGRAVGRSRRRRVSVVAETDELETLLFLFGHVTQVLWLCTESLKDEPKTQFILRHEFIDIAVACLKVMQEDWDKGRAALTAADLWKDNLPSYLTASSKMNFLAFTKALWMLTKWFMHKSSTWVQRAVWMAQVGNRITGLAEGESIYEDADVYNSLQAWYDQSLKGAVGEGFFDCHNLNAFYNLGSLPLVCRRFCFMPIEVVKLDPELFPDRSVRGVMGPEVGDIMLLAGKNTHGGGMEAQEQGSEAGEGALSSGGSLHGQGQEAHRTAPAEGSGNGPAEEGRHADPRGMPHPAADGDGSAAQAQRMPSDGGSAALGAGHVAGSASSAAQAQQPSGEHPSGESGQERSLSGDGVRPHRESSSVDDLVRASEVSQPGHERGHSLHEVSQEKESASVALAEPARETVLFTTQGMTLNVRRQSPTKHNAMHRSKLGPSADEKQGTSEDDQGGWEGNSTFSQTAGGFPHSRRGEAWQDQWVCIYTQTAHDVDYRRLVTPQSSLRMRSQLSFESSGSKAVLRASRVKFSVQDSRVEQEVGSHRHYRAPRAQGHLPAMYGNYQSYHQLRREFALSAIEAHVPKAQRSASFLGGDAQHLYIFQEGSGPVPTQDFSGRAIAHRPATSDGAGDERGRLRWSVPSGSGGRRAGTTCGQGGWDPRDARRGMTNAGRDRPRDVGASRGVESLVLDDDAVHVGGEGRGGARASAGVGFDLRERGPGLGSQLQPLQHAPSPAQLQATPARLVQGSQGHLHVNLHARAHDITHTGHERVPHVHPHAHAPAQGINGKVRGPRRPKDVPPIDFASSGALQPW